MKYILKTALFCFVFSIFPLFSTFAAIDFTITPLKYELNANTGSTITKTASIKNNGTQTVTLYTGKSDFVGQGRKGIPKFVRRTEVLHYQFLSPWITIDTDQFDIAPWEEKTITFTIDVPADATPGGHYWAVFFKNPASETSAWASVWINVDYWVLLLVNVAWNVNTSGGVSAVSGEWWGNPGGDNTEGKTFVGTTFDSFKEEVKKIPFLANILWLNDVTDTTPNINDPEPRAISFVISFKNDGNTHIKPDGKIEIVDEDGNVLKAIGRKTIYNDLGAVIWEEIVDYLPFNDEQGNVLPWQERDFENEWQWFPYKALDENGQEVVKYKDLWEFYTDQNLKGRNELDLSFWEQLKSRIVKKKLTANIDVSYFDDEGNEVPYSSAQDIYVEYKEQYIGMNWAVISIMWALWFLVLVLWYFALIPRKSKMTIGSVKKSTTSSSISAIAKNKKTYYDILEVKTNATQKQITDAYKKLKKNSKNTKQIEKAYEVLSVKKDRDNYDKKNWVSKSKK